MIGFSVTDAVDTFIYCTGFTLVYAWPLYQVVCIKQSMLTVMQCVKQWGLTLSGGGKIRLRRVIPKFTLDKVCLRQL